MSNNLAKHLYRVLPLAVILIVGCAAPPETPAETPAEAPADEDTGFQCEIDREGFRPEIETDWRDYTLNTLNRPRRPTLVEGLEKLRELRGSDDALTAVDLGAGAGNDTRFMLADGYRVHSVEPDPFAVAVIEECARQQGTSEHLEVHAATFEAMTLPEETFDFAHASLSLPFAAPATFDQVWDRIAASLAVGGVFSGDFFGPEHQWAGNPDMTFHSQDEVRALFARHPFEILELREEKRDAPLANGGTALFHQITVVAVRR